jgi:hypothetical protein
MTPRTGTGQGPGASDLHAGQGPDASESGAGQGSGASDLRAGQGPGASDRPPPPSPWRKLIPWVLAAALLAFLFLRLPRAELARALAAGPYGLLAAWAAATTALSLLADAAATRTAFAATGLRRPFGELLLARGATYLLGLIHSAVGQGGLGLYLLRTGAAPGQAFAAVVLIFITHLAAMALVAAGGMLAAAAGAGAMVGGTVGGDVGGEAGRGLGRYLAGFAGGAGSGGSGLRPWLPAFALLVAVFAAFVLALRWKPHWLVRRPALAPLFAAGPGGFLAATAARVPHVLAMVLGLWVGLRLWGVPLPIGRGTVLLSVVLLVAALPIAPNGLGTTEAALVVLASPYAPLAGAAARQSVVLAFCMLFHLFGIAVQALLGLVCLGVSARRRAGPDEVPAGDRVGLRGSADQSGRPGPASSRSSRS